MTKSKKPVGKFTDESTGQEVLVIPKDGETKEHAIARVRKKHSGKKKTK